MNENITHNITHISDLPDIHNQSQMKSNNIELALPNSYIPLKIHPNPYGNSINNQSSMVQPPIHFNDHKEQYINHLSQEQKTMLDNTPYNRLPSRDIQIDTSQYLHDEQVQNNYIPQSNKNNDYVREHEENSENYRKDKQKIRLIDSIFTEIQIPLFISIIYFIFQMPFINNIFIKYFSFLNIYNQDGNINFKGLVFKSLIFGTFYYFVIEISKYISEL